MKLAIASGKGGTGKTTIATNLAVVMAQKGLAVELLDCDVEEPNCHIFVKPKIETEKTVMLPVPKVDKEKCTGCGICGEFCQYSAIVCLKGEVVLFSELCHGCGGCMMLCPAGALTEEGREVGVVEIGQAKGFRFGQGRLRIGEVMTPALIRAVKAEADAKAFTIIDAPPGTSCSVVEVVKDADFVILATEPTPFGLNDLKLAVDMVRILKRPLAVAINRCDCGDEKVKEYCKDENIEIILEIPNDLRIAQAYSKGEIASECLDDYDEIFSETARQLTNR